MDTARVDISYRPLRVGWAIASGDFDAFRKAVRYSHTLWGGKFNPIIPVDGPIADDLVEKFGVDEIVPVGTSEAVTAFRDRFQYLRRSIFDGPLFERRGIASCRILDVHNQFAHLREGKLWASLCEEGIRTFSWDSDDPLADVFLMRVGAYPSPEEIGVDYASLLQAAAEPHPLINIKITKTDPVPLTTMQHPSLGYFSRGGLQQHYSSRRSGWDYPGFFYGDSSRFEDLVDFWNLVAADISVFFVDANNLPRYELIRQEQAATLRRLLDSSDSFRNKLAVWARPDRLEEATHALFPSEPVVACRIDNETWKYGAVRPPVMFIGEETSLGVLGRGRGRPRLSFALKDKPFVGDDWFSDQHLVASIAVMGGLYDDDSHTFHPPHVPELNRTFARDMGLVREELRLAPDRLGVVISASDHDLSLTALPVELMAEKIFDLCGMKAKPSAAGLVTRQLISRLGGVDGSRPFKIAGVRRLIKTYGPRQSFTKKSALQIIGSKDTGGPGASFDAHQNLYIEPRPHGSKLTPEGVFGYLVEKGLFRIGAELNCTSCRLSSWIALDQLRQQNACELCGTTFDGTRQLVDGVFHYRRSGILGLEKNTLGAVPVALLLQQLSVNCRNGFLLPSLDLVSKGPDQWTCETDFLAIYEPSVDQLATRVVIGECKDLNGVIDEIDIANMSKIMAALSGQGFSPLALFAKLGNFSPEEVALAKTLHTPYQPRVILLTHEDLEPYFIGEARPNGDGSRRLVVDIQDLAEMTEEIYFPQEGPRGPRRNRRRRRRRSSQTS